jgi:RNA polymerase sigma factor (sigma-70 family)
MGCDDLDGSITPVSKVVLAVEDRAESITDELLVKHCVEGSDRQSFRLLYRRYQDRVRQILYQMCDPIGLDDLVQEVFLRAWKGLPKFRHSSQFSTWLYRIAWNVASDRRQTLAQDRSRLQTIAQNISTQHNDPDLMQLHYQDLVRKGLSSLSEEHRSVLVLHDLEELPQKEVAEILEIPVGTVKSRLFHARSGMRKFLEKSGVQI